MGEERVGTPTSLRRCRRWGGAYTTFAHPRFKVVPAHAGVRPAPRAPRGRPWAGCACHAHKCVMTWCTWSNGETAPTLRVTTLRVNAQATFDLWGAATRAHARVQDTQRKVVRQRGATPERRSYRASPSLSELAGPRLASILGRQCYNKVGASESSEHKVHHLFAVRGGYCGHPYTWRRCLRHGHVDRFGSTAGGIHSVIARSRKHSWIRRISGRRHPGDRYRGYSGR